MAVLSVALIKKEVRDELNKEQDQKIQPIDKCVALLEKQVTEFRKIVKDLQKK
ncbi:MAG: hypothetical protein AAFR79_16115 [Pseudomonadota bacterium]